MKHDDRTPRTRQGREDVAAGDREADLSAKLDKLEVGGIEGDADAIFTEVLGKPAIICDTLNGDSNMTREEGRAWLEKLVHRHNTADGLIEKMEAWRLRLRSLEEKVDESLFDEVYAISCEVDDWRAALSQSKGSE
jgi:hypothetical protein